MINEKIKITKEKLDFYIGKRILLHIVKNNGEWLNALVVSKESENVYIIKENKFGLMHLFVVDVSSIEEYRGDTG